MKTQSYLSSILCVGAVIVCVVESIRLANIQSTMALAIFNALFISLAFQLSGSLSRKLFLLALGNITGLCWNFLFAAFALAATDAFGKIFLAIYSVFFPFVSSVWIVSFWALSLNVLRRTAPYPEVHA